MSKKLLFNFNREAIQNYTYVKYVGTVITATNTLEKPIKSAILKGKTLVNLFDFKEPITVMTDRMRLFSSDNFKNNLLNGTYTIINTSNKKFALDINDKSTDVWKKTVTLLGGQKTSVVFDNTYIRMASFAFSDGWSKDNLEEIKRSLVVLNGEHTDIDIPYFEGMQSVKIPVLTTTGKNLFDGVVRAGSYLNGEFQVSTGETANTNPIKVKANTNYIGKVHNYNYHAYRFSYYDEDFNFISSEATNTKFLTTPSNCCYLNFHFGMNGFQANAEISIVEDEKTLDAYEPFKSNILTVNEDVTLRSNGDICDELNLLTGQLTQRIGEDGVVLSQEAVKTVDLSILDQNENKVSSISSFNDTTHITASSETIPPIFEGYLATKEVE